MSAVPLSRPLTTVDRLVAGVSRISVRHSSGRPRYRKPQPELTGFPEGHGEKIFVFSEVRSKMVAYSHSPVLNVRRVPGPSSTTTCHDIQRLLSEESA